MRSYVQIFFTIIISQLMCVLSFAQTANINRLKDKLRNSVNDQEKIRALFALCEEGNSMNPDTLISYAKIAGGLAKKNERKDDELRSLYYQTLALITKASIDSALSLADQCLSLLSGTVNDPLLKANFINQKGRSFVRKNQYKEAIAMGYQTIAAGEKLHDTLLQLKGKTLIGWAYMEMGQMKEALIWHLKAYKTTTDSNAFEQYPVIYANLSTNYTGLNNIDSAFYFAEKAITTSKRRGNLLTLANADAIASELYAKTGRLDRCEELLKEAVEIRKIIGDPFYIASDMAELGYFYAHNGEPQKGIDICNEGIDIAKKYSLSTKLFFLYANLADNYKAIGNTEKYAATLEKIISLKDSVYQKNSAESLAEMQTKYDLQIKENLIIQQKLDIQQKNYLFYGSLLILFVAAGFSYFLFNEYKRRQKLRMLKMQEEEKILSAVAVTKAQENERKRIAADLHDNLGAYAAAIASNVDHIAQQRNNENALQELKINSQSIVSQLNDTIWVLKKDNLSLTAISDRIKVFIQQISNSYPDVNIDVIEKISSDLLLPPAGAFHLYQIVKEAIINSLKHSTAKHIRVYFESEKEWKITIADDGSGISSLKQKLSSGNGLSNMKNRSREAGWDIDWAQNEPHGTSVIISPTTN